MGNVSTWSRTQEAKPSKAAGLSLFSAKASMVISVMFCIVLRAVREFGVEMGRLWHPIALGFRERNADCPAAGTPSSHFHCAVNTQTELK